MNESITNCVFCQIASGAIKPNIVYQDDKIMCFLDMDPINEGHVLIIPREHYLDIDEMPNDVLYSIMLMSKMITKAIKSKYLPDGYSIMQNGGVFNDVGHYHLHVFPRYHNDKFGWTFSEEKHNVSSGVSEKLKVVLMEYLNECEGVAK